MLERKKKENSNRESTVKFADQPHRLHCVYLCAIAVSYSTVVQR